MLGQAGDALLGLAHALAALKAEGLGDDANGEGATFLGHLGQDRRRPRARAAAHAGGDEHQVCALERLQQLVAGFLGGLLADHRIAARAQPPGEFLAQLQPLHGRRLDQGLGIGVEHPIAHALQVGRNHAIDRIAAATTDANHLNASGLAGHDAVSSRDAGAVGAFVRDLHGRSHAVHPGQHYVVAWSSGPERLRQIRLKPRFDQGLVKVSRP